MTKFMLLYRISNLADDWTPNADPAQADKIMDLWMAWFGKCGAAVVDGGSPLGNGQTVTPSGNSSSQAPYVAGYSIMQGDSIDQIKALLDGHPHLMSAGNSIEVLEVFPMGM